ncbi:hypothetical protein [Polaribacter sp.]|uniref:hypothetical protein n=1 Tax=Polaribacter sp. TaxID=1920175 RepID=UPI003F69F328
MKTIKTIILLILFSISINISAQKPEKKAKKIADEMTEVLELDKKDSKAIYKIQFERFKEGESIRKEFADQPEIRKEKLNKLGNKVYNQLKDYLGMERLKEWRAYKQSKKKN